MHVDDAITDHVHESKVSPREGADVGEAVKYTKAIIS